MHRGMSNSHIRCATILMVATAPRLCTPDVKEKPFSMKKKIYHSTTQKIHQSSKLTHLPHKRSDILPTTIHFAVKNWCMDTMISKHDETKQNCFAECPTGTNTVQRHWRWYAQRNGKIILNDNNIYQPLANTQNPSKLKNDKSTSQMKCTRQIVYTNIVHFWHHCLKHQTDKLTHSICAACSRKCLEKHSPQLTKQCTICNHRSPLTAQISHVERKLNTSKSDWLGAKFCLHCTKSHKNGLDKH